MSKKELKHQPLLDTIIQDANSGLNPICSIGIRPMAPPRPDRDSVLCISFTGLAVYLYEDGTWEYQDTAR